jgi:hypothetical protein
MKILSVAIFGAKVNTKDLTFNFPHFERHILIDTTPTHIKVQELDIARKTLPKDHHVQLLNMGSTKILQTVKLNVSLVKPVGTNTEALPMGV